MEKQNPQTPTSGPGRSTGSDAKPDSRQGPSNNARPEGEPASSGKKPDAEIKVPDAPAADKVFSEGPPKVSVYGKPGFQRSAQKT